MFDPFNDAPLCLQPVLPDLAGLGIHVDLVSQFDAAGTYVGSLFPSSVAPAPRQSGPDGRDEGALNFNLSM